jgi:hypothetical protein
MAYIVIRPFVQAGEREVPMYLTRSLRWSNDRANAWELDHNQALEWQRVANIGRGSLATNILDRDHVKIVEVAQ